MNQQQSRTVFLLLLLSALPATFAFIPHFSVSCSTTRSTLSTLFSSSAAGIAKVLSLSLPKPLGIVLEEVEEGVPSGVFVKQVGDSGSAAKYADQIVDCKLLTVQGADVTTLTFDDVMEAIIGAPDTVDLTFQSRQQEQQQQDLFPVGTLVTVVAEQKGKEDLTFQAKVGDNLRQALLANGFEVYQGMKQKLGNCGGGGTCTFCAVDILESEGWEERVEYENKRLTKNPKAKLACLNPIQGPVKLRKADR